jgi:hypothetical protein
VGGRALYQLAGSTTVRESTLQRNAGGSAALDALSANAGSLFCYNATIENLAATGEGLKLTAALTACKLVYCAVKKSAGGTNAISASVANTIQGSAVGNAANHANITFNGVYTLASGL